MIAQPWGGRDETADADEFREVRQDHPPSAVPVGPGLDHSLAGAGSGGADGIPEESAGFFTYTDDGGIELDTEGRPEILRHKEWFEPRMEPFQDARDAYRPLVWQCRYGGIEVPDELWSEGRTGVNRHYSENQAEGLQSEGTLLPTFDAWFERFIRHVGQRGAVEPGRWRAYGYNAPKHSLADLRLKWREMQMSAGAGPAGSSPAEQHELGLNDDATFTPKKGEGEKLRENK